MASESEWRDRFIKLSEQQDEADKACAEAESQLMRLITRLCVVTRGLDATLDPHLERLRKAARAGAGKKLQEQAQELGDALLKAQDERGSSSLIERALQNRSFSSKQIKKIAKLWAELSAEPSKASDDKIDQLSKLLFPDAASGEAPKSGGLFGRILNRENNVEPNKVLRDLLQAIKWPDAMQPEVEDLRVCLGEKAEQDAWVDVVKQISDMAVQAFEKVHQDAALAEEFLSQLSERILMIDEHMLGDGERRLASRASGEQLGKAVNDEVGDLTVHVEDSEDLSLLRRQVSSSLDRIQSHVALHLGEEAQRSMEAEDQAEQLQKQLKKLEEETFDLRRQVAASNQKALSDPLTGLPNRRAYDERAEQEIARWKRFAEPLALLVWDIDDFKKVNDVFGHKAGDKALVLIAKVLHDCLRETDFIARYGGEEFVILLTGADEDAAFKVAEMMRKAVENVGMHSRKKPVKTTLSGGIAMMQDGDDIGSLFERADKIMYEAKKQGKNRCLVA